MVSLSHRECSPSVCSCQQTESGRKDRIDWSVPIMDRSASAEPSEGVRTSKTNGETTGGPFEGKEELESRSKADRPFQFLAVVKCRRPQLGESSIDREIFDAIFVSIGNENLR